MLKLSYQDSKKTILVLTTLSKQKSPTRDTKFFGDVHLSFCSRFFPLAQTGRIPPFSPPSWAADSEVSARSAHLRQDLPHRAASTSGFLQPRQSLGADKTWDFGAPQRHTLFFEGVNRIKRVKWVHWETLLVHRNHPCNLWVLLQVFEHFWSHTHS